jgi:hypothetical protein
MTAKSTEVTLLSTDDEKQVTKTFIVYRCIPYKTVFTVDDVMSMFCDAKKKPTVLLDRQYQIGPNIVLEERYVDISEMRCFPRSPGIEYQFEWARACRTPFNGVFVIPPKPLQPFWVMNNEQIIDGTDRSWLPKPTDWCQVCEVCQICCMAIHITNHVCIHCRKLLVTPTKSEPEPARPAAEPKQLCFSLECGPDEPHLH